MENKLVTIVIPAFNREKTINYCLDSVLKQTYRNIEIIVIDDASKDSTVDIVNSYSDPRLRCIALSTNQGAQVARNEGIKQAKGEWIAFQDSDDEWLPDKLERQLEKAEKTGAEVIYCECYIKKDKSFRLFGSKGYEGAIYRKLLIEPDPTFPGILVKKDCLVKVGLLDINVPAYQEWDTCIMLAKHYTFAYCKEPLFIYHIHDGETISKNIKRNLDGIYYIMNKYMEEIVSNGDVAVILHYYSKLINGYQEIGCDVQELVQQLKKYKSYQIKKYQLSQRICIFGASSTGEKCIDKILLMNKEIIYFVDNKITNNYFHGFPVYHVNYINQDVPDLVVLASFGNMTSMLRQLIELNINVDIVSYAAIE